MKKLYSPSTRGFYSTDVHAANHIPTDAVEITEEDWVNLLNQQSEGKHIVAGTHGSPIAVDRKPTREDVIARRDAALASTDALVSRHRDEVEMDPNQTTLTSAQYAALQAWRRALRNITAHPDFPDVELPDRPV